MKNKILVLTVVILGLMLNFSAIMAQELPASDDVLFSNELQAIAGSDRNVVVGRQVLFSGNASVQPAGKNVKYLWDFGDGIKIEGVDVTHVYTRSGVYRTVLTISYDDQVASDEIIVSVDKDIVLLITDSFVKEDVRDRLQEKASTQGILLVDLHVDDSSVDYLTVNDLMQKIIDNKEDIKQATNVILLTHNNIGLDALISASQELSKTTNLNTLGFKNKNLVVLTDESLNVTAKIAQNVYGLLTPQSLLVAKAEALELVIGRLQINQVVEDLKNSEIEYQLLGVHTQRPLTNLRVWNVFSYMVSFMVNNGVSLNTIYLILILPVIATLIAFSRQIIGVKSFGLYAPTLVAMSFLVTGIKYGIAFFVVVLLVGTLGRLVARKIRLMYLPRMAIVLSIVSLSIFVLFFVGSLMEKTDLIAISIFPILIMVIITEKFISSQIELGSLTAFKLVLETLVLSIVSYLLANWQPLRSLILGYPEFIFVTFLLNYLIGKWNGLRLLELYRFRKVIKNVEISEKK